MDTDLRSPLRGTIAPPVDSARDNGPYERALPKTAEHKTQHRSDCGSKHEMSDHAPSSQPLSLYRSLKPSASKRFESHYRRVSLITCELDLVWLPLQRQVEKLRGPVFPCLFDELVGKKLAIAQ